jgi:hypothetical protein
MASNRAHFRGAFYWNSSYNSCRYGLTKSTEFSALRHMHQTL